MCWFTLEFQWLYPLLQQWGMAATKPSCKPETTTTGNIVTGTKTTWRKTWNQNFIWQAPQNKWESDTKRYHRVQTITPTIQKLQWRIPGWNPARSKLPTTLWRKNTPCTYPWLIKDKSQKKYFSLVNKTVQPSDQLKNS